MNLNMSRYLILITDYKSPSQRARVLTEAWSAENLWCPSCEGQLTSLPPNSRTSDFVCGNCGEFYQLKSKSKPFGKKIVGAHYITTIQAINNGCHPSLILLQYDASNLFITNIKILHRSWITEQNIVPRPPLSSQARRAGWQGCLIFLDKIPSKAFVVMVQDGVVSPISLVRAQWNTAHSVSSLSLTRRGWLSLILRIIESFPLEFSLQEIYAYAHIFAQSHPENKNIKAKIRQQLQIARDLGLIEFIGQGFYRRVL
ncbi:MAG TPA: hypothetical protein DCE76_11350 [Anaerolineaceae bacterium]|nr:hypothetical protein [Anaerolineaceae bacterium]